MRSHATRASRTTPAPDRYDLYELAVQAPEASARFLRAIIGAPDDEPRVLGEDFSGAGAIARAWVRLYPGSTAVCADRDPEPIRRLKGLRGSASVLARRADVMRVRDRVDVLADFNFAICELTSRKGLLAYLRHARSRIRPGGALVVDLYGGMHAFVTGRSGKEIRSPEFGGVRYEWEQREADPAAGLVVNAMHFSFRDPATRRRVEMRDAFVYRWRLWSIAEIRDAMEEARFDSTEVHASLGDAVDERGRHYVRPIDHGDELDDDYVVYVVGRRAARRSRGR